MKYKLTYPRDESSRKLEEDENMLIAKTLDENIGTSIFPNGDYSITCRTNDVQSDPRLAITLKHLLRKVFHPSHVEWVVRCLPLKQVFDGRFLEEEFPKVAYSFTLNGWGDTISRSKMTGVEGLIRKVLEDREIEARDKMFFVLAAPGRLPKSEARKHVLAFIPVGPGVAAEAIRKIAEPEDLATFEALLETKQDSWDRGRIETTVRQLRKKFGKT